MRQKDDKILFIWLFGDFRGFSMHIYSLHPPVVDQTSFIFFLWLFILMTNNDRFVAVYKVKVDMRAALLHDRMVLSRLLACFNASMLHTGMIICGCVQCTHTQQEIYSRTISKSTTIIIISGSIMIIILKQKKKIYKKMSKKEMNSARYTKN